MTSSLTSSSGRTDLMFGSLLLHRKDTARRVSVIYPLLKHLNTGTLAFAMFVAVALLSSTHGKNSETRASARVIKTEVAIDNFSSFTNTLTLPARATVTWTNNDNVSHVVASADNQFSESGRLEVWPELFPHLRDNGNLLLLLFHSPANYRKIIVK